MNLIAAFLNQGAAVIGVTHYDISTQPSVDDYYQCLSERGDPWPVLHVDVRKSGDVSMLLNTLLATLEYA